MGFEQLFYNLQEQDLATLQRNCQHCNVAVPPSRPSISAINGPDFKKLFRERVSREKFF